MINPTITDRCRRLAAAAAIAGALWLGCALPAVAASALIRPPSVTTGLDLGIWLTVDPGDDGGLVSV